MDDNQNTPDINSSLEDTDTVAQNSVPSATSSEGGAETLDSSNAQAGGTPDEPHKVKRSLSQRVQGVVGKMNIYLMLFVLVIILAGIAAFASYSASKRAANNSSITSQNLSAEDLQNLKNNDTQVGDAKQTLTIASNSIFNGRVLIRDSLDVAGTIRVGGALSLPGITVSGTSAFENVNISNNLSINGNAAVQGTLTVQKNLTVGGGATFAGTISAPSLAIDQLVLNNDLVLNRHISAGGPTPSIDERSGLNPPTGTADIDGSDTAGTITLHFTSGTSANILAKVTFANSYSTIPRVVITPVESTCAYLNYYVRRDKTSFELGTTNAPPTMGSCSFDYMVME